MILLCFATTQMAMAQEICNNGRDDDGDNLIDCFDPECCDACKDHYFFDCDTSLCDVLEYKDSVVLITKWRYENAGWDRRNTPLVGSLRPGEISVVGISNNSTSSTTNSDILIINGEDGTESSRIPTSSVSQYGQSIGIADLNDDGQGEIIIGLAGNAPEGRKIVCYNNGSLRWVSPDDYGYSDSDVNMSPQFADFDQDGNPEIYFGNQIFSSIDGSLICQGGQGNNIGLQSAKDPEYRFYAPTAVDILPAGFCADCDGLELVAGNQIYSVNIGTGTMNVVVEQNTNLFTDGLTSVADVNGDGQLDVIVAQRIDDFVNIWAWDPISANVFNRFVHNATSPSNFSGGSSLPLVTDIDMDGDVDIVFTTSQRLIALENDGSGDFSFSWVVPTNDLSGRSGPVAFDFNGDGLAEIVHRGAGNLRVVSSINGEILDEVDCYSPTYFDKPIVANVDSDPGAEILCSCGNELRAFTSGYSQWSPTRPVWNQMNYYNVHINDDLQVPQYMQGMQFPVIDGRRALNSYLEQYSQPEKPASDLYFNDVDIICTAGRKSISAEICNDGEISTPPNVYLNIYSRSPATEALEPVWSDQLSSSYESGQCRTIQFAYPPVLENADTIYLSLNAPPVNALIDTSSSEDFIALECDYQNNIFPFDVSEFNSQSLELGNDTTLCPSEAIILGTRENYMLYQWSTGSTEDSIEVSSAGEYSLTVTDACGNTAADSLQLDYQTVPDLNFPPSIGLCLGDSIDIRVNSFDSVNWYFDQEIICSGCDQLSYAAFASGTVSAEAWINGCIRQDSFMVQLFETPQSRDTIIICPGDSAMVFNNTVGEGMYTEKYDISGPCDSVSVVHVQYSQEINYTFDHDTLCLGEQDGSVQIDTQSPGLQINWADGSTESNRTGLGTGQYPFLITDPIGCTVRDTLFIRTYAHPLQSLDKVLPDCGESDGQIDLMLTNENFEVLLNGSSLGQGSVVISDLSSGAYEISILYNECRLDTQIVFSDLAYDSLLNDVTLNINLGDTVLLGQELLGITNDARWEPSDGLSCSDCLPVMAFPSTDMTYILTGTAIDGCPLMKTYIINVDRENLFYMPNIFTPDGNNINDELVFTSNIPLASIDEFLLFDRWGGLLVEKRHLPGQNEFALWDGMVDGKQAKVGVYVYYMEFTDITGKKHRIGGDVTLMR